MKILLKVIAILFLFCGMTEAASPPLPASQAFVFTVYLQSKNELLVKWQIAPHYYLYQDRLTIAATADSTVKMKPLTLPKGELKENSIRGPYFVYKGTLQVPIHLKNNGILDLVVSYQGCSEQGFCYAPLKKELKINLKEFTPPTDLTPYLVGAINLSKMPELASEAYAEKLLDGKNVFFLIASFIGLGFLLSLTPCVLPMVPVLSAIIMGHRHALTVVKTFLLSFAYVLGMAMTYAAAGIGVALLGSRVQTWLQQPLVIVMFSVVFVFLALSLFGLYELKLPRKLQSRLTVLSNQQKGGTYFGVFCMGSISSLIVSPCVSAPLVGVLAYIGHTGDMFLGAAALFALGFGMGIPLLLLGASAGSILPRAGGWMQTIEHLMGFFMLAFAIWMLSRIVPGPVILFLWGLLLLGFSLYLGLFKSMNPRKHVKQALGLLAFIYSLVLIVGAGFHNEDPLNPWANWKVFATSKNAAAPLPYVDVKDTTQLDHALQLAKKDKQPVMLDFYADWCQSCIKMEKTVFSQPKVQAEFKGFILLRINVTQNTSFDQSLMKRYNVIAPPTFLFFNQEGDELQEQRIIGEVNANHFIAHLTKIKES